MAATVVGIETDVRTPRQGGQRVDSPLQVHVTRPVVGTRVTLVDTVRESTATRDDKTLGPRLVPVVGVVVVPRHATAQLKLVLLLIAHVKCGSLRLTLTLAVAASATAATSEVAVVHVIRITHKCVTHVAERFHSCQADAIAVMHAIAHVGIGLQAATGTALRHKLQHKVVVTVVDTRHPAQVALLIVGLHLVHHVRRQVLHHRVVIARHKVATVHLEAFHVLAVDADLAVLVNLCARQGFHQRLNHRTLGHLVGVGVIHHRVVLDDHLLHVSRHHYLGNGITLQRLHIRHAVLARLTAHTEYSPDARHQ